MLAAYHLLQGRLSLAVQLLVELYSRDAFNGDERWVMASKGAGNEGISQDGIHLSVGYKHSDFSQSFTWYNGAHTWQ